MPLPASIPESEIIFEARDISKSFPGVRALDGVRLAVRRGELHALLGENGAGKSTLMNILAGVFPADSGELILEGESVRFRNPREAQEAGISIIFQELNLAANLTVAENIFLGREPTDAIGFIDKARMEQDAAALLRRLGLELDPGKRVEQLTIASQQVVEIAKAVSFRSKVLILDEPTSALTKNEAEALFRVIAGLKADGVGLVYITHRLEELAGITDEITVFRDGQFVANRPFAQTTPDEMVRLMVGRDPVVPDTTAAQPQGVPLLAIEGATVAGDLASQRPLIANISFEIGRGEIVGLFGLMGAGRTELLQAMFGMYPSRFSGRVRIDDQTVELRSPTDAIRAGLALAPEDRKTEGVVLEMSITENTTLACLDRALRFGLLSSADEQDITQQYVGRLGVKTPSLKQQVRNLSGGNQQKVVLAKWLATSPKVLLLDEPTRGIDIGAKQEIYRLIRELASEGLGVLVVSSELPEILALSHRILVMCEGTLTGEFSPAEAHEDALLSAALPKSTTLKSA